MEVRGWRRRDENAFAYEIKWRIYTVRSQYTYVRSTVNYTVNRGVLFDRRGKEDCERMSERANGQDRGRRIESRIVASERGRKKRRMRKRKERSGRRRRRRRGCTTTAPVYGARDDLRDDS